MAVAALVACVALWPLCHRALALRYGIDPWKLGGFAMYATYQNTRVALFGIEGGGLTHVDDADLPERSRAALQRFARRRGALGAWASPDEAARVLHAERPELGNVVFVVQRMWLDAATARIASEKHSFVYVDGLPLEATELPPSAALPGPRTPAPGPAEAQPASGPPASGAPARRASMRF